MKKCQLNKQGKKQRKLWFQLIKSLVASLYRGQKELNVDDNHKWDLFTERVLNSLQLKVTKLLFSRSNFVKSLSKRCFYELLTFSRDSMNATESLKITQPSHQRKFLPYCKANLWNQKEKYVSFVLAFFRN